MGRVTVGLVVLVSLSGCFHQMSAAERIERHGWHRLHPIPESAAYDDHFERLAFRIDDLACAALTKDLGDPDKPIIVLLHGAGGEGVEMKKAVPLLVDSKPAALFVLRWSPWDRRETLVNQLAGGISRLAECIPGSAGRLVVIAHSAGGVLAALAAGKVVPPKNAPRDWVTVVTVAAPLSGHIRPDDRGPEPAFMFDLANTPDYPHPAPGVRVLHLRTTVPGDVQMTPIIGHAPNDVRVGVPGAPQIDLPENLTHAGALIYVSRLVADGSFHSWLEPFKDPKVREQARKERPNVKTRASGRTGPVRNSMRARTDLFSW